MGGGVWEQCGEGGRWEQDRRDVEEVALLKIYIFSIIQTFRTMIYFIH